jgi:hypothetical protein
MALRAAPLRHIDHWFHSDAQLHHLYPEGIQALAERHWTPLRITLMALEFLIPYEGVKILDIGSGVGKFVLAGAYYKPGADFYGVEQRKHLVSHAETARTILGLENAHFINKNFTQLDFAPFDHFYFFNSFYENLFDTGKIDESVSCSPYLYNYYSRALYRKLRVSPPGTRVVTFHCLEGEIAPGYQVIEEHAGGLLKCWMKI